MKFYFSSRRFIYRKAMSNHRVFVYGTLKTGQPNHHWLENNDNGYAQFLGKGETIKKYPLIIASKYNIPFLLHSPGMGKNVIGEVYEVDDKMLSNLDILEDHPTFYIREKDEIQKAIGQDTDVEASDENKMECWVYFLKHFKPSLLSEPFLTEYNSKGDHLKPYMEKEQRIPGYHARNDVLLL